MESPTKKNPVVLFAGKLTNSRLALAISNQIQSGKLDDPKGRKQRYLSSSFIVYAAALWRSFIKCLAEDAFGRLAPGEAEARRKAFAFRLGMLQTPKAANIDALFEAAAGIEKITSQWHWEGVTCEQAKQRLSVILDAARQAAALDYYHPLAMNKQIDHADFLVKLARITCEAVEGRDEL